MVKLDLPGHVLDVLRAKEEILMESLLVAMRKKADIEQEIQETQSKLAGLRSLTREPGLEVPESETEEKSASEGIKRDIISLPMGQAALAILKSRNRYMTASEIVQVMKEAGRVMRGPNSRDMITMSLKRLKDKVQIRRIGVKNRYKAK